LIKSLRGSPVRIDGLTKQLWSLTLERLRELLRAFRSHAFDFRGPPTDQPLKI
jgi:hypothetical protein